jgi:uncharacterized protein YjiS (DUF1127 family)
MSKRQPSVPARWRAILWVLRLWWQRGTTRRSLRHLEARQLQDAGLTDRDRATECAKWFWQA